MADIDFLARHAEFSPNRPALIFGGHAMDFATLNHRADKAATVFTKLGCERRDRVASMYFNCIEQFEIANGVRKIGLVGVPVNYRLRGAEIAYVLNDSGAKVVCAGPEHVDIVDDARADVQGDVRFIAIGDHTPPGWLSYQELMADASGQPAAGAEPIGGLAASMIYTSGKTGPPQGG